MKHFKIFSIFLFISFATIAQSGMVFQGIARDNNSAAITNKVMTFTFSISQGTGPELFKETQQIRTDNFGVFSHVIGTGSSALNTFESVNFDLPDLKVKIIVNNDGVETIIYNQAFHYTAYAKHAQNGVPIGTVVAFMGNLDKIPDGWILADGRDITEAKYANLKTILGGINNVPNLRGEFLKGAGATVDANNITAVNVRERQIQNVGQHNHNVNINGVTNNDGLHNHTVKHAKDGTPFQVDGGNWHIEWGNSVFDTTESEYSDNSLPDNLTEKWVSKRYSAHQHAFNINGNTGERQNQAWGELGQRENRPDNVGVYWIIRYK